LAEENLKLLLPGSFRATDFAEKAAFLEFTDDLNVDLIVDGQLPEPWFIFL
jgi:hypothetical protein